MSCCGFFVVGVNGEERVVVLGKHCTEEGMK
jgi:hypothetical protein